MTMKKLLSLALIMMMALMTLTSCGVSGLKDRDVVGTWECTDLGDTLHAATGLFNIPTGFINAKVNMVFDSDHTFAISAEIDLFLYVEHEEYGTGTWAIRDGKLFITSEGETVELNIKGNKIILDQVDSSTNMKMRMTFKKA